ncbi:MAG: phosphoglycerate dehydrogenase [Lachnospiraceae bacterium]|nr:phosphoglycerate dehydrogenase [Lachnospiraceae bacterium]
MKILVTPTSMHSNNQSDAMEKLREFAKELVFNPTGKPLQEEELIELLKDCDGYLAGLDFVTEKVIQAAPNLKVISRYGAGYDRVDIEAAKKAGIPVTNTPGVNAQAVGELAMGLILSLARRIPYLDKQTKSGAWVRSSGMELKGKTLGILGLGAIGKVVARCGQGFGMKVIAYDPFMDESYCREHEIENGTQMDVMKESDVISLHIPLNDETLHYVNKKTIQLMKSGVIIVNTSRGGLVHEQDAYEALQSGRLGGLGLDAFAVEPPEASPLFELDNVVLTPHTGAHTKEATENMANASVKNLMDVLTGKACPFIVN